MRAFFFDDYGLRGQGLIAIGAVVIAAFLALVLWLSARDEANCAAKGGHQVQTGTSTSYVLSGKVLVPITSPVYSCEVPA